MDEIWSPAFFKALCEPSRLAILQQLTRCCEPMSVSEIAACCPLNLSVVSRHLATLREAGILEAEKRGKEVYYSLQAKSVADTLRALADALEAPRPLEEP
jgi:DNA-binding transcriptional ArsR family regulator